MKTISVIVPAFNAESTIERCLNSILNQTFSELEIIVVNDGSSDETENIIKKMSLIDRRIRLISIPNNGVSHARNIGLDSATGDYITFVDSDDTVDSNIYEHLLFLMNNYQVDVAHCSYKNCDKNGVVSTVGNQGRIIEFNHDEALESLLQGKFFTGALWNKLYKSYLFERLRLDENISINEDELLNVQIFNMIDRSVYSDKPLYNYFSTPNSSTHINNYLKKARQGIYVGERILEECRDSQVERSAIRQLASRYLFLYESLVCFNASNDEIKETKRIITKFSKEGLYQRRNERIKILLLNTCPIFYRRMFWQREKHRKFDLDPKQ